MPQLLILRREAKPNDQFFEQRVIRGQVGSAGRSVVDQDGAIIQTGGTTFNVPHGSVKADEFVLYGGQHFKVTGIAPQPPFQRRDRLETDQAVGLFRTVPFDPFRLIVDGEYLNVDGYRLVV